jgi:hypothetical protein
MRLILASAGIALMASSVSATAADCTKGLLWPYVRHPGDCLTDAEIQAGKTGVYSGPATGQVDVSTIKPPAQLNSASPSAIQCSHSWYWPFGSGDCQSAPVAAETSSDSTVGNGAAKDNPSVALPTAQPASAALAVKPQAAATPAAMPLVEPVRSQPPVKPQAQIAPPAAAVRVAAECHKGVLWPFVREDGDCSTAAESGKGKPSAAPIAASTPAAMPVSAGTAPPAVEPVAAVSPTIAATCTKGTFWPFIREVGDCATAAEKANGKTSAVPNAASEPAAMPVSAAPPPSAAPSVQPAAVANPATMTCTKGTFWPFIREAGDCATAAEKGSGKTSAIPIDASAPAVNPLVVPAAATMPEQTAPAQNSGPPATNAPTCHKGLFWPFVRDAGDCPTDADKGPQHNPP